MDKPRPNNNNNHRRSRGNQNRFNNARKNQQPHQPPQQRHGQHQRQSQAQQSQQLDPTGQSSSLALEPHQQQQQSRNPQPPSGGKNIFSPNRDGTDPTPHETGPQSQQLYQGTLDTTSQHAQITSPNTTDSQQSSHIQMQQQQYLAQQHNQQQCGSSSLDRVADDICDASHCATRRAIDSVYAMPISDHVYYNSFDLYNNLMLEQQRSIVGMMSALSTCYYQPMYHPTYPHDSHYRSADSGRHGVEFGDINGSADKYEVLHKINNEMFDEIGHNLDYADGSHQSEAQSVQATLIAASRNRLNPSSQLAAQEPSFNRAQFASSEQFSSSSSSTSIMRSNEFAHPASFNPPNDYYENQQQQQRYNQFGQNQQRFPRFSKSFQFRRPENKNIPRPQDQFIEKIDNSFGPFVPIIKEKPNATVPLDMYVKRDKHNNLYYEHPYTREIEQFQVDSELLEPRDPIEPMSINNSPIIMVETIEELESMCTHIESQREFAVDVEHHSYRSYQGLTCLLQISTRTQDFVIDAIKLRSELHRLNKSFTNPNIVKVFHGADCDVLWLQRDFGIYVVNLFDTSRAAKLMKFPHLSLAFLMKHYCNIDPDKSYQLADWRERPLPSPMLQYARSDTHYLLYIYDRLRSDLLTKDNTAGVGEELLRSVFQKGKEICLKRYEKPPFSEKSHLSVLKKSRIPFNAKQMYALREMYAWRDRIGRELDESVGFVLPNSMMMRIAEALPREPQGITALVKPVPQILNKYLSDVHAIILRALDVPLDEKSRLLAENPTSANPSLRSIDLDTVSHKQDIAHSAGVQENSLPNLLDDQNYHDHDMNGRSNGCDPYHRTSAYSSTDRVSTLYRFVDPSYNKKDDLTRIMVGGHNPVEHFVPPYERYKESTR